MEKTNDGLFFVSLVKKFSMPKPRVKNGRITNGLLYRMSGTTSYEFSDKTIVLTAGNILFLPKGGEYNIHLLSREGSFFYGMNFEGNGFLTKPRLFTEFNRENMTEKFEMLYRLQTQTDNAAKRFQCQSIMYDIFSELLEGDIFFDGDETKKKIKPSLDYLYDHLFDPELEVDHLGIRSGISDAYFRSLFHRIYGVTPKQYVTEKRMAYAGNIIKNGDYEKIYEVANAAGFSDALYFSKVFKKYFHMSPKQFAVKEGKKEK